MYALLEIYCVYLNRFSGKKENQEISSKELHYFRINPAVQMFLFGLLLRIYNLYLQQAYGVFCLEAYKSFLFFPYFDTKNK